MIENAPRLSMGTYVALHPDLIDHKAEIARGLKEHMKSVHVFEAEKGLTIQGVAERSVSFTELNNAIKAFLRDRTGMDFLLKSPPEGKKSNVVVLDVKPDQTKDKIHSPMIHTGILVSVPEDVKASWLSVAIQNDSRFKGLLAQRVYEDKFLWVYDPGNSNRRIEAENFGKKISELVKEKLGGQFASEVLSPSQVVVKKSLAERSAN